VQTFVTNNVILDKKVKTQQQQNKTKWPKRLPKPEIEPGTSRDSKRMRYHCTTESTESNDCSQAF